MCLCVHDHPHFPDHVPASMIIVASDCPSKHIQRQGGDDSTRMITWGTIIQWEFQDPKIGGTYHI